MLYVTINFKKHACLQSSPYYVSASAKRQYFCDPLYCILLFCIYLHSIDALKTLGRDKNQ